MTVAEDAEGFEKLSFDEREFLAIHEAGHCIVARSLGLRVEQVLLGGNGGKTTLSLLGQPLRSWEKVSKRIAIQALAGQLAVRVFARGTLNELHTWDAAEGDMRVFDTYRVDISYRHARREALRILRQNDALVRCVAAALGSQGRLNADEVNALAGGAA